MYKKSEKLKLIRRELEAGNNLAVAIRRAGMRSYTTIEKWRKKRPLIDRYLSACIDRKDTRRINTVEDALFKSAIEGNTTAQIFFLTNRAPDKWKDRRAVVNNKIINKVGENGELKNHREEMRHLLAGYFK